MRYLIIILSVLLLFSFCTGSHNKGSENNSDSIHMNMVPDTAVEKRVRQIYEDVFTHYRNGDYNDEHFLGYYSEDLRKVWNSIQVNYDEVGGMLPWLWAHDFEMLEYTNIHIDIIDDANAIAVVTLKLFADVEPEATILRLVLEKHGDKGVNDWYVDDFIWGENTQVSFKSLMGMRAK